MIGHCGTGKPGTELFAERRVLRPSLILMYFTDTLQAARACNAHHDRLTFVEKKKAAWPAAFAEKNPGDASFVRGGLTGTALQRSLHEKHLQIPGKIFLMLCLEADIHLEIRP